MVVELEKWSQIWKHSSRPKNGQGCENMVADLEKWSKIWLNGCRSGKMVKDLEKIGADLEKQFIQILYIYGPRSGKMVRDVEKWSQIWKMVTDLIKWLQNWKFFLQIWKNFYRSSYKWLQK